VHLGVFFRKSPKAAGRQRVNEGRTLNDLDLSNKI